MWKSGSKLKACLHCIHKISICSKQIPKFCSVVSERLLCVCVHLFTVFVERYIFEVIFFLPLIDNTVMQLRVSEGSIFPTLNDCAMIKHSTIFLGAIIT